MNGTKRWVCFIYQLEFVLYKGELGVKNFEDAARRFNIALKAGRNEACYYLGRQYKYGEGVEVCNITAKNFFQRGTNARVPGAISQLGDCYEQGIGVEISHTKCLKLLKRGAEAGDPYGMGVCAWCKLNGKNTDVNLPLAYRMSSKAVKGGFGLNEFASCYEQGIGLGRNPTEAIRLCVEGINKHGSWMSALLLARIYEQGRGVDVDLRKAAESYRRGKEFLAYERPHFHAYYGMCLTRGRGVLQDVEKGWEEVEKSIRGNNATGWFVKGECYRFGYGVDQDRSTALTCYQRAVHTDSGADGKIRAEFALGCMHEAGEGGLSPDLAAAFEHFDFAANRMHQEAQWKVGRLCETGNGVSRQEQRAVYYFRLAANSGHRDAQLKASKYYMKGKGVSRDLHTALQILRPAAENGDLDAQRLLGRMERRAVLRRLLPIRTKSMPTSLTCFSSP